MSKNKPDKEAAQDPTATASSKHGKSHKHGSAGVTWHPLVRVVVSLLLVAHVAAVAIAPWSLSSQPALPPGYVPQVDVQGRTILPPDDSPVWQLPVLQQTIWGWFRPYLNAMYLNHGYEFFAPDPNGSHIIRYQVYDSGGTEIASGKFPDLSQQWPRLYYHRHMMLAAQLTYMGEPAARSYAHHLLRVHGGRTCQLEWEFHRLLTPQEVIEGKPLDDPSTYQRLETIRVTAQAQTNSSSSEQPVSIPEAGRQ